MTQVWTHHPFLVVGVVWGDFFSCKQIAKQNFACTEASHQHEVQETRINQIYHHQNALSPQHLYISGGGDGLYATTHSPVPDQVLGTWSGVRDIVLLYGCNQVLILCCSPQETVCTINLPWGNVPQNPSAKGHSTKPGCTPRLSRGSLLS